MAQQNRTTLKTYFNTGDTPTEAEFIDLIDSAHNIAEDGAPLTDATAFATAAQGALAATAVQPGDLATVATSGAYADLTGAPTIPAALADLTDVDATVGSPTDGDILVYRAAGSDWVLETKPVSSGSPAWGDITGTLSNQADLNSALANKQAVLAEGAFVDGDKTKLNGIETGATADQTGAEIKALYEAESNTNAYTDAEKTKLNGIAAGAEVNTIESATAGEPTGSDVVLNVVSLTQAEYDAGTPVATTLYIIT